MDQTNNAHRIALIQQAAEILNLYTPFRSDYTVSFSLTEPDENGLPRIAGKLVRTDGVPFAESIAPMDAKLRHMKDQTVGIRPFFMPMMKAEFDETEVNEFANLDFDYAAIIGYAKDSEGKYYMKALYLPPTDAFIEGRKPGEDGVWRKIPLPTFHVYQMSLDPRKKFARSLYLALRMSEAMEYEYDKYGRIFSNP